MTGPLNADAHGQLRAAVDAWVALSDSEFSALAGIFHPRHVDRNSHVILPGAASHDVLFVTRGLLRFCYTDSNGLESNKAFVSDNEFAAPLAAFHLGLPVSYGVQALEATSLFAAAYAEFVALFDRAPVFDRLGRKLAEYLLIRKERRTRSFLQQDAAERYADFVREHPDLVDRVPQYHIASYLGISEVSLSRLKRARISRAS